MLDHAVLNDLWMAYGLEWGNLFHLLHLFSPHKYLQVCTSIYNYVFTSIYNKLIFTSIYNYVQVFTVIKICTS